MRRPPEPTPDSPTTRTEARARSRQGRPRRRRARRRAGAVLAAALLCAAIGSGYEAARPGGGLPWVSGSATTRADSASDRGDAGLDRAVAAERTSRSARSSSPAPTAPTTTQPATPKASASRAASPTTSASPSTSADPSTRSATTRSATTPAHRTRPTTPSASSTTPSGQSTSASAADQVVALVNAERAKAGCRAVTADAALTRAAQGHSTDMADHDYFSHVSLDGRTFDQRIHAAGYPGGLLGENIAAGQRTPAAVMDSWMNSPGHRANILSCRYTKLGVGLASGGTYGIYWTQDFGG